MPTLNEFVPGSVIRTLVYGRSKIGKTAGAGTFPRPNFIDFDSGIATLTNDWFVAKYGWKPSIQYQQFTERSMNKGVPTAANAFDDACKYFDEWMGPSKRDTFDTWVIDSGTTLSEAAMTKAVVVLGKQNMSQTHKNAQTYGFITPKQQDYGAERSMVEQFVDMVYESGKHFVLLCHEKEFTSETGAVVARVPLLTGQSAERIPLKFDEVWNLRVLGKKGPDTIRGLISHSEGVTTAGTRLGVPDGTEWNYDSVTAVIKTAQDAVTQLKPKE